MKNLFIIVISMVFLLGSAVQAGWIEDIKQEAEKELEPFIKDMGAALSGGVYERGDSPGFPGLETSVKVSAAGVSDDNKILTGTEYIVMPYIAAEAGLPLGIGIFARGFSYKVADAEENITFLGGGVRYSVFEDRTVSPLPGVSAAVAYNKLSATGVGISALSIGASVSKKLLFVKPYAGLSYVIAKGSIDTEISTLKPEKNFFRMEAGLEIKPFPAVFLKGGINSAESAVGWDAALGIRLGLPV